VARRRGISVSLGTRITLVTSAVVALMLGVYSVLGLRSRRAELEAKLQGQAGELATALAASLEVEKKIDWSQQAIDLPANLDRSGVPWHAELLAAKLADGDDDSERIARLRKALNLKAGVADITKIAGRRTFVFVEPVREPSSFAPDRLGGAIEISRDMAFLDDIMADETLRSVGSLALLIVLLVVAISLSMRRAITGPIGKLIAGIDDVAKGDLSHTLFQEQEDEIGALAARFNEMTQSLRAARAETRRGVEDRLSLEAHLRATAQLATIGQLAAEIAHEVGTPLNVVTGRARAMAKKSDDPEAVQKNATIIAEQAGRITRIIQRLLDVARRRVGGDEKATVDLNKLAQDTLELLEYQLGTARIETRVRLERTLEPVPGDKDQLQQVFLNLYMNAVQAMPDGGTLEVHTRRVTQRRPGLEVAPEQAYVVVQVSDTGVGIKEEDRAKIFEAFYTSRSETGGTGLGLAVAHGIVKDHDGWIEITDAEGLGGGTSFRIYIPEVVDTRRPSVESNNEEAEAAVHR
jgi:signal transduction histidine kinase